MASDTNIALARLDGFLCAFEWFNQKTNHVCRYFAVPLPQARSLGEALAIRFGLPPMAFQMEPLANLDDELRGVFARFLLMFQSTYGDHLTDPRQSFSLFDDFGRATMLDELAVMIRSLGVSIAWRVVLLQECGELREWCFQEDIVLELDDRRCLLHFGVSD